jgi:hypothetical protein
MPQSPSVKERDGRRMQRKEAEGKAGEVYLLIPQKQLL